MSLESLEHGLPLHPQKKRLYVDLDPPMLPYLVEEFYKAIQQVNGNRTDPLACLIMK